jgi:xylulokinase
MSDNEVFLGIDVGTSGTKCIAVGSDGRVRAACAAGYPLYTPQPGWVEQEPADWWRAVCSTVRDVVDQLPGGAASVTGIGLSGHMSSLVPVDIQGQPLRRCITVADGRGGPEAAWLTSAFGPRLERLAGGQPGTSDVAPKLLWLKAHEPDTYARMSTFLFAKDYVRLLLTGNAATEPTDAGNTFFLDLVTRSWDVELCAEMGLDPGKLPSLLAPTDVAGMITPDASTATGLKTGTPVVAGGADMAASVVGMAAVRTGVVAVTIGTSAQVTTALAALPAGGAGRVSFHAHPMPPLLYLMGSIFSGGLTLRWLAQAFGEEHELDRLGSRYFEALSEQAATAAPGSDGALFLPFLVGSGTPDFDPVIRGSFLGLSLATGRPQLVRAALEGVAHNARECLEVVRSLGLPVARVHLGGGGSASAVWREIIAGTLGVTVHPTSVRDASALGAAALAAVGLGAFANVVDASDAMVVFDDPIEPDERSIEHYSRDYETYVAARVALRDLYRDRAARVENELAAGAPDPVAAAGPLPADADSGVGR